MAKKQQEQPVEPRASKMTTANSDLVLGEKIPAQTRNVVFIERNGAQIAVFEDEL